MNTHQRYMQYRKDELYHGHGGGNPYHDPRNGQFTSGKGLNVVVTRVKTKITGNKPSAPKYEQDSRDSEMQYAATYREFQLMYQEKASDESLDYWDRSDNQTFADEYKRKADSEERLAKANDGLYNFKPSKDEPRLDKANDSLSKLKRFDEPAPDVSKTKPGSDERLRALDYYNLQKAVEASSGDWYNSEPKSNRWKKIYRDAKKNGKKVIEHDLAKAALLDMGYKATPENIDYLVRRHVIFWD